MEYRYSQVSSVAGKSLSNALFVVSFALYCFVSNTAFARNSVTVIYPVYHNDTDKIIAEIREGITNSSTIDTSEIPFDTANKSSAIIKRIRSLSEDEIVITLTSDLKDVIRTSGFNGLLIDGVSSDLTRRNSTINVGIEPSPYTYIDTALKIRPDIKNIIYFTFYNDDKNEERRVEKRSDDKLDIKVVNIEGIDDAMHKISDVIALYDPSETAIWLPNQILSISNNTVLRYVLREAWRKSFIVFTDSLEAVARGLLFSLMPDYRSYGEYLASIAGDVTKDNDDTRSESIEYFNDVYLMLNQRFSVHLGLNINRSLFDKYKIVVPAK